MKKIFPLLVVAAIGFLAAGCPPAVKAPAGSPSPGPSPSPYPDCVSIADAGTHYEVIMDYGSGATRYQMGYQLGQKAKALVVSPSFQALADSYIDDSVQKLAGGSASTADLYYGTAIARIADILPRVPQEFRDEIDGLAASVCDSSADLRGDGRLSKDELYLIELILDVSKLNSCSAVSVYGARSATGKAITGRALDWYAGESGQLARIQAVTTVKNGSKSIVLVGYLGYLAGLTVLNDDKVFAAILESSTPALAVTANKRSYSMDLRYAMENFSTLADVAAYLSDPARSYVAGHLVFLSDPGRSQVLENDLNNNRGLRDDNVSLNAGISWGIDHSIGAVNSFVMKGNYDNHTGNAANTARWASLKAQLAAAGSPASASEVQNVISYFTGALPGAQTAGDLYNESTQQMVLVEPNASSLKVFFRPKSGTLPATPVFENVPLGF